MEKLTDNLKKVILAGIGAVATTAEKSKDVLDDMVKKYTEAMELVKFCNQKLANATETVNKILNSDGSFTEFKPE